MNYCLIFSLLLAFNTVVAQIPNNGLVAYYNFQSNVLDISGSNFNAIPYGCSYTKDRFDADNSALLLNGSSDSIEFPVSTIFPTDQSFTISMWFNSSHHEEQELLNLGNYSNANNFTITLNGEAGSFIYWNGAGTHLLKGGKIGQYTDGKWHNIIITKKDSLLNLFVDKKQLDTTFYYLPIGSNESFLSGNIMNNSTFSLYSIYDHFEGAIDDLVFYNRCLDSIELSALYHSQRPITLISPKKTDVYPINTACDIEWLATDSIARFRADYSTNNGATWNLITDTIDAKLGHYNWDMQFPVNTLLQIRLIDYDHPSLFIESGNFQISPYQWELVNDSCNYSRRDGAGLLAFKNKLWYLGGWGDTTWAVPGLHSNEVWSSADGENWTFVQNAPWEGRHTCGWLVYNNKMWVIGGDGNSGNLNFDIWNTSDGVTWNLMIDSIPIAVRMTHMTAVLNNRLILFGGQQIVNLWTNSIDTVYNDVWESINGINWTLLNSDAPWSPRGQIGGNCVDASNTLWLLGGGIYYNPHYFNDVWNSTDGISWNKILSAAPWPPRVYHEVSYFDNKIWVIGGNTGFAPGKLEPPDPCDGDLKDVWYSENGIDWFELKNTPWLPRHAASTAIYNNQLWLTGGYKNDIWKLTGGNITQIDKYETKTYLPFKIYPNPSNNYIYIETDELIKTITIQNSVGQPIKTLIDQSNQINIQGLNDGLYFIGINGHFLPFLKQ